MSGGREIEIREGVKGRHTKRRKHREKGCHGEKIRSMEAGKEEGKGREKQKERST
jgi:hypothetical protein